MTAATQGRVHAGLAFGWLAAVPPIVIWLSDSIPFVVAISVYAVVVGHWSGWQAARAEVNSPDAEPE